MTGTGDAEIHEIWPWDGSANGGAGGVPATSRNQAGTYTLSAGTTPIPLDGTNTINTRGTNNWKWWWLSRLTSSANGVAIRAQRMAAGSPTVEIDHVELVVTYVVLYFKIPVVDYRAVAYDKVAGTTDSTETNENGDLYRPRTLNGDEWHDESVAFLEELIAVRSAKGLKRLVFGTPAGSIRNQIVSSHQWEPMFDDQRAALMSVIPAWLKGDPEREAILYVGTKIDNPAFLSMANAHEPDVVNSSTDVAILERTFFPYRDCVGIRRFLLDASNDINRDLARDLFAWGRENGMEFVMEAIPHTGSTVDATIVEEYGAYALSGYVIGDNQGRIARDPDFLWNFTKGRLMVQVVGEWHDGLTTEKLKQAFFQRFAREGYVLMPTEFDGSFDEAARRVGAEYRGMGVSGPVAFPPASALAQAASRFIERGRPRSDQ